MRKLFCEHRGCRLFLLLLFVFGSRCFFLPLQASSEVYHWTDEKGNTIYSDSPPPGTNAKVKKLRVDRIERPDVKQAPAATGRDVSRTVKEVSPKRELRDITVILYSTDW